MRDTSLLQLALGVAPPWSVTRSDFDAAAKRLDPLFEMLLGGEVASAEQLAHQDGEPDLDLIDP